MPGNRNYIRIDQCPRNINGNSSFCKAQELVKSKAPTFSREGNFYTSNFSLDLFTIWREIKPSGCNCRRRTCCALNTAFALGAIHKRCRSIFPILCPPFVVFLLSKFQHFWPPSLPLWGDVVYGWPLAYEQKQFSHTLSSVPSISIHYILWNSR